MESKYKEDFKSAKEWYKIAKEQDNKLAIEILENKFPELKESEDERIRKGLIEACKQSLIVGGFHKDKVIAWLEKQNSLMKCLQIANARIGELIEENYYLKEEQNEQKPWSAEDEEILNGIIVDVEFLKTKDGKAAYQKEIDWLKSIKDRVQWKPSDRQMKALKEACDEHWEPDGLDPLYVLWEQLKKLREE